MASISSPLAGVPAPLAPTHSPEERRNLPDGRTGWRHYRWGMMTPKIVIHFLPLACFWVGFTSTTAWLLAAFYALNMFAITAGYHRYFSHRTFKTSRPMQFLLAWFAMATAQRGVLTWALDHRTHHKKSDLPGDVHSPVLDGFLYSHLLWIYNQIPPLDLSKIRDLAKYPELVWLEKYYLFPPLLSGTVAYLIGGWSGLFGGFLLALLLSWHFTFCINSIAHMWGRRDYDTTDDSRNNWLLALATFGEGWHNNHHHYMSSTRQGFRWWQIDITFYVLWGMSKLGLVWDLKPVPPRVLEEAKAGL